MVLSGLDPTGGAGLLADIRALSAAGVRIAPMITASTIQGKGVTAEYFSVDTVFLGRQLDTVFDLFQPHSIKIGMIGSIGVADAIGAFLRRSGLPAVLDPVMQATSGGLFIMSGIRERILDFADRVTVLTPNRDELGWLSGLPVDGFSDVDRAVRRLTDLGYGAVYVKGGHFDGIPKDVLYHNGDHVGEYFGERLNHTVRGTGCHLASFIAAHIAQGVTLEEACGSAYRYVQDVLKDYGRAGNGILPADIALETLGDNPYNQINEY